MKIQSTRTVDTHNKDATKGSGARNREIFIRITAFLNIRKIENNRLVPLQCKILRVWNSIPSYAFNMVQNSSRNLFALYTFIKYLEIANQ